jgi:hypothetical protein
MKRVLIIILLFFSCENLSENESGKTDDFGSFSIKLGNPPSDVSYIIGEMSSNKGDNQSFKSNIDTIIVVDSLKEATWTISLSAYSLDSIKKYIGEATFQILAGEVTTVNVQMNKLTGIAEIEINWGDSVNLDSNLVAYYPFDGNTNDYSGNGLNLTNTGATLITDRNGNLSAAYSFDGIDDFMKVSDNPLLDLSNELTISFFFQINELPSTYSAIIAKGLIFTGSPDYPKHTYGIGVGKNGKIHLDFVYKEASVLKRQALIHDLPSFEVWHHIAMTYKNGEIRYYLDGFLIIKKDIGDYTLNQNNIPLYVGTEDYLHATEFFKGSLDDIRIYSRALNDTEIRELAK